MKNNRFLHFTLLALLLVIMGSCAQSGNQNEASENVQHFRHLLFTETAWDEIKGIYELTPEEAEKINNYKFVYDEADRLVSIEYCRGDSLIEGSRLGAAKILISYDGNKEIRHYLNIFGDSIQTNGDVFKSVFEFDENGFKKGLKYYGLNGEPIENRNKIAYYTWSKTPLDMIKENRYNLAGEETVISEFCPFYELRFSYDDNGVVKRMANYEKDVLYDCTAENCGNIGVSYFDFDIDEKGSLKEFSVHSTTGQLSNLYWGWARFTLEHDENGYVTERVMYDQDNELVGGKMIPIQQFKYDEFGSVVEERNLDANRQLMDNPRDSVAVRKYEYTEYGFRTKTVEFDKNMVEKGIAANND